MDNNKIINGFSLEEYARLNYAVHLWRRCGYEAEAEAAQVKADKYYLAYKNALRMQAGLPALNLEELWS